MNIRALDLKFRQTPGLIAAWLLESAGEKALVEAGPGSTLPRLLEALQEAGATPGEIGKVFVTHVHLDHAGAAGWWARQGARVYCHPRARRHLVDPSRLLAGAHEVYGEAMESLWGEMLAAPEDKVTALEDGENVTVGEITLTALDTPGHARHHHAYAAGEVCFTGDVAGIRLEGSAYLSVAAAPPQFELEPYLASARRLRAAGFERLCLTHFGEVADADAHLAAYETRLREVAEQAARHRVLPAAEWRQTYRETERARALQAGVAPELWEKYELANGTGMCADGLRLWAGECSKAG